MAQAPQGGDDETGALVQQEAAPATEPEPPKHAAEAMCAWVCTIDGALCIGFCFWVVIGWIASTQVRWGKVGGQLTTIEAFYWMAQILTTVGYGDLQMPVTVTGHAFVTCYLIASGLLVATFISKVVMGAMAFEQALIEDTMLQAVDDMAKSATLPGTVLGASRFQLSHEAKDFLSAFAQWMGCVFVWAAFFVYYPGEEKDWMEAIYMGVVTLTTVGFGDVTPQTSGGKLFASFGMLVGVERFAHCVAETSAWLLQVVTVKKLDENTLQLIMSDPRVNKAIQERQKFIESRPAVERFGTTIARNDFALYLLLDMGLVDEDVVDKVYSQFDALDKSGDGFLDFDDLPDRSVKRPIKKRHQR